MFSKTNAPIFQEATLSYIFLRKVFLVFWKAIFRTQIYLEREACLELEVYSEHCQTSMMKNFANIAT